MRRGGKAAVRCASAGSVVLCLGLLAGCRISTGLSSADIEQRRTIWSGHQLTRYAYVYEQTGFFSGLSGRAIRLVVLGDTVLSATDLATGESVPVLSSGLPTVDGLFDRALAGAAAGSLTAITYDAFFGFPSRMDFAGPPDASGSDFASGLQLLP